jgi:hypothetical protein
VRTPTFWTKTNKKWTSQDSLLTLHKVLHERVYVCVRVDMWEGTGVKWV